MVRLFWVFTFVFGVVKAEASPALLNGRWHVGLEFGEIPIQGSFKPGLSVGYHFNAFLYAGVVYQIRDHIQRDGRSFNAKAIALDGLIGSSENVGQRAYAQMRLRPHRLAPYVSLGVVFNDCDTETIEFDARNRIIAGQSVDGVLEIVQKRPRGIRPALGLGYSYTLDSGFEIFTEWSGWWVNDAPTPVIEFSGAQMHTTVQDHLRGHIVESFKSSIFNIYHVFQIGVGYTW